jgi:hypothetical protein
VVIVIAPGQGTASSGFSASTEANDNVQPFVFLPTRGNLPFLFLRTRNSAVRFPARVLELMAPKPRFRRLGRANQYEDEDGAFLRKIQGCHVLLGVLFGFEDLASYRVTVVAVFRGYFVDT